MPQRGIKNAIEGNKKCIPICEFNINHRFVRMKVYMTRYVIGRISLSRLSEELIDRAMTLSHLDLVLQLISI